MIHRRQFLIETGASLGAWFLKQQLADRIIRVFQETGRPLLLDLEKPDYTFEVDSDTGIIRMVSEGAIELDWSSTWREFATVAGANPDCPDELKELCITYSYWSDDNEEEEPYEAPDLDDTVNEAALERFLDGPYATYSGPEAQAFHYLRELDLGPSIPKNTVDLGVLMFRAGQCPGRDLHTVSVNAPAALSCLQHRLLELGESVEFCWI